MLPRPTLLRRALTTLCAVTALLPAVIAPAAAQDPARDPRSELSDVQGQLEQARGGLADTEGRRQATLAELAEIDARRRVLDERLGALSAELAGAQEVLRQAEAELAATTQQLVSTEAELAATRQQLAGFRELLGRRANAAYKFGMGPSIAAARLDAPTVTELTRSMEYVRLVMAADRERVSQTAGLERQIRATTTLLAELRDAEESKRLAAQAERDRVAGLVAAEQQVRDEVQVESINHQFALAQLEADKEAYTALVGSLEQASADLEAELRRIAEQQAREAEMARLAAEEAARRGQPAPGAGPPPAGQGRMQWPANGPKTSNYGYRTHPIFGTQRMHTGIDIGAGYGSPIYAAADGVVLSAGDRGGYGLTVVIDHGGGLSTLYAHQSRLAVATGTRVGRGDVIGYIGSTGYSTGPHLHFEVRVNGEPRDPMAYF